MIKETVNEHRFVDVLMSDEYAGWTLGATRALYEYYEQMSDDLGEDIELDRVAIRCDWSEYPSAWDAMLQYQPDDMPLVENSEGMDLIEIQAASEELAREWLEERTHVIDVENLDINASEYRTIKSILIMQF